MCFFNTYNDFIVNARIASFSKAKVKFPFFVSMQWNCFSNSKQQDNTSKYIEYQFGFRHVQN